MKKNFFTDEQSIIQGIKSNNSMAITLAYKKYYPSIANFIRLNGGNNDDAKDIFQEAMMILYYNLNKENFKLTCQLSTYLYSISRNLWLTELRRLNKTDQAIEDLDQFIGDEETQIEEAEKKIIAQKKLKLCLDALGDPCKSILISFYIDKLSMHEIAKKMGYTNAENAKNQKYKCLMRLKKIFQKL